MKHVAPLCVFILFMTAALAAQEPIKTKVPAWDARGVGPLPRMGITSIDVSDDGKEIVVGTIAAFGDPNVIVLNDAGKVVRTYRVGQQWIDNVAFLPGSKEVLAICTMPAGKAGDRVEAFQCKGEEVIPEKIKQEGVWFFHYGDHSNHPTMKLGHSRGVTTLMAGNQIITHGGGPDNQGPIRTNLQEPDAAVSLAVDDGGYSVVGRTKRESVLSPYLNLYHPIQQQPIWSHAFTKIDVKTPAPEKGQYGAPTLPDGTRAELPQRDEKVWAPLAVALGHVGAGYRRIATAEYQGWQRWVRSSATMKDDNQGLRFAPARPTITVYEQRGGKGVVERRFAGAEFAAPFWCDMRFSSASKNLYVWPRSWRCRGLAGQPTLPADEHANTFYILSMFDGKVRAIALPDAISDAAFSGGYGDIAIACWDGSVHLYKEDDKDLKPTLPIVAAGVEPLKIGGPSLVRFTLDAKKLFVADTRGIVSCFDLQGKKIWQIDLNAAVPKSPKPWVANARATPIVPGVWQIPGGRVESDLGGQRLIEAPDGYILIEGHAGLSFEREWASMVAVGLDPMKIKYVLATHEHGDHAPGAYLWRVVTGAKFVCSEEMAYTLQHHIPQNTGYGLHPPVPTDIVIKKDQELDLAGLKVRAIRIPGHTAGSMAWHFEKSGKTFVAFGDLIMPKGVLGYSGSVNFSAKDALASLRKLRDLKPDYVLPGHGAVEGPANYLQAGVDVGTAVGWGFIKPERPDPRFRITRENVVVVGWGQQATSAAFGDVNGDGKLDVVMVSPDGDGSILKFFLNHDGKFNDQPDREIKVPVNDPHKLRCVSAKGGPALVVAGKSAALLMPTGKFPAYEITPFDFGDGNHLRFDHDGTPLVSRRFGGFYALDLPKGKPSLRKYQPDIDGPYVDFRLLDLTGSGCKDLLTAYGQLHLRGADGKLPKTPSVQLPREKDWTFLAVGDFNGDGKPDAAFLSYGMDGATAARVFYHRSQAEKPFAEKADAVLPLNGLLSQAKKGQGPPLVRDTPVVADWNGDGIDDLIVAHGQSDEVLILLGGKDGLSKDRVQRIQLEYRVHYEHGVFVGDFNGDGKADLAVFGYTNTGVGASGPPAVYLWLQ